MGLDITRRIGLIILFTLIQVLVLNHIHLFGYATPLLYIYFLVMFSYNYPKWLSILISFIFGIILDIFSNTPGESAFAMTLTAFLQPYILGIFIDKEKQYDMEPKMAGMGFLAYGLFVGAISLIYSFTFFAIEAFTLYDIVHGLLCIASSWVLTVILILCIDSVRK